MFFLKVSLTPRRDQCIQPTDQTRVLTSRPPLHIIYNKPGGNGHLGSERQYTSGASGPALYWKGTDKNYGAPSRELVKIREILKVIKAGTKRSFMSLEVLGRPVIYRQGIDPERDDLVMLQQVVDCAGGVTREMHCSARIRVAVGGRVGELILPPGEKQHCSSVGYTAACLLPLFYSIRREEIVGIRPDLV